MFPRRFFPGHYFAPRFYPQSGGEYVIPTAICGTFSVVPMVTGTFTVDEC